MKKLRITTEESEPQIPLLGSIQKKCRVNKSTIPNICIINGEEYQIQAIIATPTKNPHQALFCQTSTFNDSQGREVLKGGRNVGDHRRKENPEN